MISSLTQYEFLERQVLQRDRSCYALSSPIVLIAIRMCAGWGDGS